jgi:hypothetical protein
LFSYGGTTVARVGLIDTATGREVRALTGHLGIVSCVAFDVGGRLISGGYDRTVRVWDPRTGEPVQVFRGHTEPVLSVASRPGTDQLASSSYDLDSSADKRVESKQWDMQTGREIRTLYHCGGWRTSAVAFSPDGTALVSCSEDGTVKFWDVAPEPVIYPRKFRGWTPRVRFSPDGRRLAVPGNGRVTVSDGSGRSDLCEIPLREGGDGLAYSRDGRLIATCNSASNPIFVCVHLAGICGEGSRARREPRRPPHRDLGERGDRVDLGRHPRRPVNPEALTGQFVPENSEKKLARFCPKRGTGGRPHPTLEQETIMLFPSRLRNRASSDVSRSRSPLRSARFCPRLESLEGGPNPTPATPTAK